MSAQCDLVLSSGFLAMARHCGVLQAVEELGLDIGSVVGTSSGALVGALWTSGRSAREIASFLADGPPARGMALSLRPWRGLFHLEPMVRLMREQLPATFDELGRPLAVGVMSPEGEASLLHGGDLPASVAASCAMPWVFQKVQVNDRLWADGGAVDRVMVTPWLGLRSVRRDTIVHLVDRTAGVDTPVPEDMVVIRTPRSRARFRSWNGFSEQMEEARVIARDTLEGSIDALRSPE